jgi:hypothetical protein
VDHHQEQGVEARYRGRLALQCSIVFADGTQTGEGRVRDVSVPGCLVESPVPLKVGAYLQLRLFLPDHQPPLLVSLAAVRWVQGLRFGLEFGQDGRDGSGSSQPLCCSAGGSLGTGSRLA